MCAPVPCCRPLHPCRSSCLHDCTSSGECT
nr:MAG TPA: hypothetical protein [Caudoviricetes sp.]